MAIENLIENVDGQIVRIRTKSLDVSFNELFDMFQSSELIISPDYQRLFRWEEEKQSRFIESLILEMPVPPIFVIEMEDNVYELIDGLQRISSYLHFRGEKLGETEDEYLTLRGCDIVPSLNSLSYNSLPKAIQIKIKRSFIRMEVIKKESDISLKYHMFKRLNTGGELLSSQEIRNCTIRLLGSRAIDFLDECSKDKNFKNVINRVVSEKLQMRYDQELVLRYFAIKNNLKNYSYPVTDYLTSYLETMTDDNGGFDYAAERQIFVETFAFINESFKDEAFSGKNQNGTIRNEFILYYYDGIAVAIASLINRIKTIKDVSSIVDCINNVKYGNDLKPYTTGRINSIRTRIRLFTEGVQKVLDGR